jgi:flagellar biosynthesis protein FlhF
MQIKRFEANNMTMALRMVKNELGPEAVILSARSLRKGKGFFSSMKYTGVEVTAAIDVQGALRKTGSTATAEPACPDLPDRRPKNGSRGKAQDKAAGGSHFAPEAHYKRKHSPMPKVDFSRQRGLSALYQQILDQGVERGIASELINEIKRIPDSQNLLINGELNRQLCSIIEEMGVWADNSTFVNGKPKMVALLGTAGVGKTTTIAKLAAVHTNRQGKQVAVISIDNYGIAANEQLKTYARIIGIPLATAVNPGELKRAIKKYKQKDVILIDTPGINPTDPDQISELKSYFAQLPEMQKHLVVSVATKEKDLIKISQAFQEIGVQRLLFTKLDESSTYGNMLNVLIQTRIPFSFLSCGRKVPDDIEPGSIQKLIELIFPASGMNRNPSKQSSLPKANRTAASRESALNGSLFVANKNSDVYHSTDCKWSYKIKPENIIQFASSQEAEAQNFLPCRSCNPDRLKSDRNTGLGTAARKYSSYH